MRIESIRIQNYKVFKDVIVKNLPKMSVFLGPNGSGKTTFFDVFGFLCDALQHNVTIALNRRGGFSEVISRDSKPNDLIKFEIKFRNPQSDKSYAPLVTYSLEIGFKQGKAFINREVLKGQKRASWNFLDFKKSEGYATINEEEYGKEGAKEEKDFQKTINTDILALKGFGQYEKFKTISSVKSFFERVYISDLKTEYGRNISETGISEHLSVTGHNLAQVSKYIYDYHPDIFKTILEKLPKRIPGINKVEAKETEDGMILLRFQDKSFKMPFLSKFVSDGTIKMFAYLILLHDPNPHPLLCIEEPENFLYPDLLLELCEEIREYSEKGGQVLISTHSPDFVNGVRLEELFILMKENGYTKIKSASDDKLVKDLAKENQLGWLWRNRYIRGANLK
jgi:predicted ATPase